MGGIQGGKGFLLIESRQTVRRGGRWVTSEKAS